MKLVLFILCALVISTSCNKEKAEDTTIPCIPVGLERNILAFYPFSNGSTQNYMASSYHLTNSTNAHTTADRNGNNNCAFEFYNVSPGVEEYLVLPNPYFLNNLSEFSVVLWYKPKDTIPEESKLEVLINRGEGNGCPNNVEEWSLSLYDCKKAFFGSGNYVWDLMSTQSCSDEVDSRMFNWQHAVAIYKNGTIRIYRNGILQESETDNGACPNSIAITSTESLFVGKNFTGTIDDIILFDKELSSQEISDLFSSNACCLE